MPLGGKVTFLKKEYFRAYVSKILGLARDKLETNKIA